MADVTCGGLVGLFTCAYSCYGDAPNTVMVFAAFVTTVSISRWPVWLSWSCGLGEELNSSSMEWYGAGCAAHLCFHSGESFQYHNAICSSCYNYSTQAGVCSHYTAAVSLLATMAQKSDSIVRAVVGSLCCPDVVRIVADPAQALMAYVVSALNCQVGIIEVPP